MERSGITALLVTALLTGLIFGGGWIVKTVLETPRGGQWAENTAAGPLDWARWFLFTPSAKEVVEAFQGEGLEVGFVPQEMPGASPCSWGPGESTHSDAAAFEIPSLGPMGPARAPQMGGQVFVFTSSRDVAFFSLYNRPPSPPEGVRGADRPKPYVYSEGLVVLCIDGRIPEEQAKEYYRVMSNT